MKMGKAGFVAIVAATAGMLAAMGERAFAQSVLPVLVCK
jgi:hypothetical protein